jgi:hypothetical protein
MSHPATKAAFYSESWFAYLDTKQQQLVELSFQLLERERSLSSTYPDYAFMVFPMAKAYEGFLKNYFYDLALIDTSTYEGRKFRVGRALNPDISRNQRDEFWLFDDVEHLCGTSLARELWNTWLECRNRVFHYFPKSEQPLTLERSAEYLERIREVMTDAIACYSENAPVRRARARE